MSELVIYHNPRCTKSRQTLTLLRERGLEPTIIEYLQTPPDEKTLSGIIDQLGIEAAELIRKKEFKALGLEATDVAAAELRRPSSAHVPPRRRSLRVQEYR